jgi:hypothetical protein
LFEEILLRTAEEFRITGVLIFEFPVSDSSFSSGDLLFFDGITDFTVFEIFFVDEDI